MVAKGEVWEGHELLSEERGMVRTFLARRIEGPPGDVVALHLREDARIEADAFGAEMQRLQDVARQIPEIVPVSYGGVVGDVAWAASPALGDAVPLIDALRGNDLGPTLLKVLIDLGGCLVRAHERELIHGAISPDRVFLGGDGRLAITHFGFVRLFGLGAEDARRDPYGYVPPELLSGGARGRRTDVYGFGTLLYELLCKRTFSTWTWPPSFPAGIPPVLQRMLRTALEEGPERRQPSIAAMLEVLTPLARAWAEGGGPPEPSSGDTFAERSGRQSAPGEAVRSSESPDTLKSVMPPRGDITGAQPLASGLPAAPTLPDLDPIRLGPVMPSPLAPSTAPPSSGTSGRRSRARLVGVALTLAVLLGGSMVVFVRREQPSRCAALHVAPVVQTAALRASVPHPPPVAPPIPLRADPPHAPSTDVPHALPPVAPRSITDRQAAFKERGTKARSMETDICYGLVSCGQHNY